MNMDELIQKAKAGDPQAQYDLAQLYEYGDEENEIDSDDELALEWYEKLAEEGYHEGFLGSAHVHTRMGHKSKNKVRIYEYNRKISEDIPGSEQYNKAVDCEHDGEFDAAADLLLEANDLGCPQAAYKLSAYVGSGTVFKYNFMAEMELLTDAAEAGLKEAMFRLAHCFEQADDNTVIDFDEAIKWYEAAIAAGEQNAKGNLKRALKKKEQMEADAAEDSGETE